MSDPRASLTVALRGALKDKAEVLSTPYSIDVCRMMLEGRQIPEILERLGKAGISFSHSALKRIKPGVVALPPELKARLEAAEPILAEEDTTAIGVLKSTLASVAGRIRAIEQEIKAGKDAKTVVSEKRDDQLMKYYAMYSDLRKQLEHERLKSEVVQAYKRAAADMCMLAMGFIKDDGQKAEFLEKVREFEQRNL